MLKSKTKEPTSLVSFRIKDSDLQSMLAACRTADVSLSEGLRQIVQRYLDSSKVYDRNADKNTVNVDGE
jgi:hypothetical protein